MEAKWVGITAVAPVAWGANYVVTREYLPADAPLWGSALRALPAGLLLMALSRRLPHGQWWWRSLVLGVLNVGGFFLLVYLAAQLLPSSVAASVMSLSPLALAGSAWLLAGQQPGRRTAVAAVAGVLGVLLLVGGAAGHLSPVGVGVSLSALTLSSVGAVLATRWRGTVPVLTTTAWQLLVGGVLLTAVAAGVEHAPPAPRMSTVVALAFTSLVATALAFVCWFSGLSRMPAGVVGTIGTLNPLTGIGLGSLVAGEGLTAVQLGGVALTLLAIGVATRSPRPAAGPQPSSVRRITASMARSGRKRRARTTVPACRPTG